MPLPPITDDDDDKDDKLTKIMKELNKPVNPNFGFGISYVQPFMVGGDLKFPTGNMERPQESVSGSFGFAQPVNVRYGMQGGPIYPWQNPNYVKQLEEQNFLQESMRRNQNRVREQPVVPPEQSKVIAFPKLPSLSSN